MVKFVYCAYYGFQCGAGVFECAWRGSGLSMQTHTNTYECVYTAQRIDMTTTNNNKRDTHEKKDEM